MVAFNCLATVLLAGTASAKLVVRSAWNREYKFGSSSLPSNIYSDKQHQQQRPLTGQTAPSLGSYNGLPAYKKGQFTLTPQDGSTCASYGEQQWTGTVDVTDERRLFYWFFESRGDPENDPVILWLNGGPGGSSMMGLLNEMGPCWLEPNATETVPNDWSWNNNASVLFIDQPAGVGFSSVAPGSPLPQRDEDGARDFQTFLSTFFGQIFPEKASLPLHIAAESYGGHYAPVYVKHILDARAWDARDAFWGNIASLILVDAVVDFTAPHIGAYELLCVQERGRGVVSDEACEAMRRASPECERLGRSCDLAYDGHECLAMMSYCSEHILKYYDEEVQAGRRNPYNIGLGCSKYPVCDDPGKGNMTAYLNQAHIKKALNFPEDFVFEDINFDINSGYTSNDSPWRPTTRQVAAILEAFETPLSLEHRPAASTVGDIRVLVLNGNEDFIVNTPGQKWAYDNLRWSGQQDYRTTGWRDLEPEGVAATGLWKGTRDGRLVFVGVDGAGHTVPGDVREGSWRIVQRWIAGGWGS